MTGGILVYGEGNEGNLTSLTKASLSVGTNLGNELECTLGVLFIGEGVYALAQEAIHLGADQVYIANDPRLGQFQIEPYANVLETLCRNIEPEILLLGQNITGSELAARIAFRLEAGLTMDCIDLSIDPDSKRLLQTKPIYGGNAIAVFGTEAPLQVATLRKKAFPVSEADPTRKGKIVEIEPQVEEISQKIRRLEKVEEEFPGIKLEDADIVVCGGRGIGSKEAFGALEALAGMLNGAVAGTRPTCERGWVDPRFQVGLTGEKVAPKLYIAIGLSGAIQHTAGITGAKHILAINKDSDANIFKEADYGAVGDYKEILPAFTDEVRQYLLKR